jgi:hypothetical protein
MYERYFIQKGTFQNTMIDGQAAGFQIDVKIAYYRGLFLSMVEGFEVIVDGKLYTMEDMTFTIKGKTYTQAEMERETTVRWDFGEVATLRIRKPGGLAAGSHEVTVRELIRISYMPFSPSITQRTIIMTLTA